MEIDLLVGAIAFVAALILILLEIPVAVAMGLVALASCLYFVGFTGTMALTSTTVWDSVTSYTLTVLPLFVLMGNLAAHTGLSTRIFGAMRTLLGHRRGGLGLATIGSSAAFGMVSGSSLATTATMGRIAIPEMRNAKYPMSLASGTVAAGGTLGIIIPPSTVLVIYAVIAEQSMQKLFLATFGPIVLAIAFYGLAVWAPIALGYVKAPRSERATGAERRRAMRELVPPVGIFIIIMGGLYSGLFTANEAAAVGVAGVLAYGVFARRLDMAGFIAASRDTVLTSGALYLVLIAAGLFNFSLALSGLPFSMASIFSMLVQSPLLLILAMTVIYIILGALMDSLAMLLLTIPLFVPIVAAADINLVWFGIYAILVVELGLITPPLGMNLFVLKATDPSIRMVDLWRGVIPFVIAGLLRIAIIVAIPAIVLWLPNNSM